MRLLLLLLSAALVPLTTTVGHAEQPTQPDASVLPAQPAQPAQPSIETEKKKKKKKKKSRVPKISGYMQVFYRYAFETGEDGVVDFDNFRVQRLRIKVKGKINRYLRYNVSVDPRAPEVSGILRNAFFSIHKLIPGHEIRVGQQKTQFGYENRQSSTRLFAVNRTEVSDNLARGTNLRDIGVGIIGKLKLAEGLRLEDALTVTNGAGLNVQDDDTDMKDIWGRVGLRYKSHGTTVSGGASGGIGSFIDTGDLDFDPSDDFLVRFRRVGADVELDTPFLFASAEAVVGTNEEPGEKATTYGWYVNLVGKTAWDVGPILRVDTEEDFYRRWVIGGYWGARNAPVRVLVTYELREVFDEMRGDDKFFVWSQVKF